MHKTMRIRMSYRNPICCIIDINIMLSNKERLSTETVNTSCYVYT